MSMRNGHSNGSKPHQPPFIIRKSRIHGWGAYATRRIRKGQRIIEYIGQRISHTEAEDRYDEDAMDNPTTYLFTVDENVVIDATRWGNRAKYINHSCDPNCESVNEEGRIFVEALRNIQPGAELTYDYHLECDGPYGSQWRQRYACRCGSRICRGTLLHPPKKRNGNGAGKKRARRTKRTRA
jgi:SET domain-containing protein